MAKFSSLPMWFRLSTPYVKYEDAFSSSKRPKSNYYSENETLIAVPTSFCETSYDHCQIQESSLTTEEDTASHQSFNEETSSQDHEQSTIIEEDAKSNEQETKSRSTKGRENFRKMLRLIEFVTLAIGLVSFMVVPVLIFHIKYDSSHQKESKCIEELYNGSLCKTVLLERQSCIPGRENSSEIIVGLSQSQQSLYENLLKLLLSLVPETNEQCGDELLEFLCVEVFMGLCAPTSTGHRTSKQDCERITTSTCVVEFQVIRSVLIDIGIDAHCDSLPQETSCYTSKGSGGESSGERIDEYLPLTTRNCSEGFFMNDVGLCKPECGVWWPRSSRQFGMLIVVGYVYIGLTVCLVAAVLFCSCVNYKSIFKFPGMFIIYQIISMLLLYAVTIIQREKFKNLVCGSRDLTESLKPGNETPFCIISGGAVVYFSSQVVLWWFFHILMIFISVFWPFKYQYWRNLGRLKYIHAALVTVAIVLPIIPVLISLGTGGYMLSVFHPSYCVGRNHYALLYSHYLPLATAMGFGMCLLTLLFKKLFPKVCMLFKMKHYPRKTNAELKIFLLILCYIFILPSIMGILLYRQKVSQNYEDTLKEYFFCESVGTEECFIEEIDGSVLLSIMFGLFTLYPSTFLIYFLKCCTLKKTHN